MSARKNNRQRVTFELMAPAASRVLLVGDFSDWNQHPVELRRLKSGQWKATVALDPGPHEYRYLVDGQWRDDPNCPTRVPNAYGSENCVCLVAMPAV